MNYHLSNTVCEVHLWQCDWKTVRYGMHDARQVLSEPEKIRVKRLLDNEDIKRYLSVHIFLHQILGNYLQLPPDKIQFVYGLSNKPQLKKGLSDYQPVYFNLSYRDQYALLGISNTDSIGVDMEKIRNIHDIPAFAADYFSREEQEKIYGQKNVRKQLDLLFTFWVMKEAFVKSLNLSFTNPLALYNMSPFLETSCYSPDFDPQNTWTIQQITLHVRYKAAFALRTAAVRVAVFKYNGKD